MKIIWVGDKIMKCNQEKFNAVYWIVPTSIGVKIYCLYILIGLIFLKKNIYSK